MRFPEQNINKAIYSAAIGMLEGMLEREDVPYKQNKIWDGYQLTFPWTGGDVVCHNGSYNSAWGHVESMGFPWDDEDVTEDDVGSMAQRIINLYKGINKTEEK